MKIEEVKINLNKAVVYDGAEYVLTGCTLRKSHNGYFYQAEITDTTAPRSVCITRLEDVKCKNI